MEVLLIGINLAKKSGKFFHLVEVLPTCKCLNMKIWKKIPRNISLTNNNEKNCQKAEV
jgi:hypothetical protein